MSGRHYFSDGEKTCLLELVQKYKLHMMSTFSSNPAGKKSAWSLLTEEYNSIEFNTRRTEMQLRKCWDNLKSRRKGILSREKKERMRTGGGPYTSFITEPSQSETPSAVVDDALMESTDVKLRNVMDGDMPDGTSAGVLEFHPPEVILQATPLDTRESRYVTSPPLHTLGGKNIRAQAISQEFQLRVKKYNRHEKREEELHQFKVAESQWLVKAAEEAYHKARLERASAEELLCYTRAKREEAEQRQNINKD